MKTFFEIYKKVDRLIGESPTVKLSAERRRQVNGAIAMPGRERIR